VICTQDEFAAHFVRLFGVDPFEIGPRYSLTHCAPNYPTKLNDMNFNCFKTFKFNHNTQPVPASASASSLEMDQLLENITIRISIRYRDRIVVSKYRFHPSRRTDST